MSQVIELQVRSQLPNKLRLFELLDAVAMLAKWIEREASRAAADNLKIETAVWTSQVNAITRAYEALHDAGPQEVLLRIVAPFAVDSTNRAEIVTARPIKGC